MACLRSPTITSNLAASSSLRFEKICSKTSHCLASVSWDSSIRHASKSLRIASRRTFPRVLSRRASSRFWMTVSKVSRPPAAWSSATRFLMKSRKPEDSSFWLMTTPLPRAVFSPKSSSVALMISLRLTSGGWVSRDFLRQKSSPISAASWLLSFGVPSMVGKPAMGPYSA